MINRYNETMAIALNHNHDIVLITKKKQGRALVFYVTNYATKLQSPAWYRLAYAKQVLELERQRQEEPAMEDLPGQGSFPPSIRVLLLKMANRIFSERELSAVEVASHLLGFGTEYSSVDNWCFANLNTLYWAAVNR